jgi:hypothetical protein
VVKRLLKVNPLVLIGVVLAVQAAAVILGYLSSALVPTALAVMGLAYVQNITYGLQSRSANRNSNAYHLIAAVAANGVFFWSLRLLLTNNLPLVLLAPYMFFTVLGTAHGNAISMRIESMLGLSAEGAKGRPQLLKLWPTIAVLTVALAYQVLRFPTDRIVAKTPEFAALSGTTILILLLVLGVLGSFTFSLLRVARSTDHYWYHLGAVALNLGISFLQYLILINNRYDWALLLPTTIGSVIGSLVGASLGQDVGKKLQAKFDAHIADSSVIVWPRAQLILLALALVPHALVFRFSDVQAGAILLGLCVWQAVSFTMISRARQRDSIPYLNWCSVFSNGVWYLTMHSLSMGDITWTKAAPYIVGNASGSLIGQNLAMHAERAVGAQVGSKRITAA